MTTLPTAATAKTVCVLCGAIRGVTLKDASDSPLEARQEQIQAILREVRKNGLHGCEECGTDDTVINAEPLTGWLRFRLWVRRLFTRRGKCATKLWGS